LPKPKNTGSTGLLKEQVSTGAGEYGREAIKDHKNREATTEQPANPSRLPLFRLLLVWGVSAAGLGLAVNLYQLQNCSIGGATEEGATTADGALRPPAARLDRNNNVLAIDRPVYTLYAIPSCLKRPKKEDRSQ